MQLPTVNAPAALLFFFASRLSCASAGLRAVIKQQDVGTELMCKIHVQYTVC